MTRWLLSRLGYATLDLDAVARAMAANVLRDYDAETLDPASAVQYFRTRYMRLVSEYGLPPECVNDVASRAWAIVAATRNVPSTVPASFALYD